MNKPDKQEEHERLLAEVGLTLDDCRVHEVHPGDWLEGPEDYAAYLNDALATGDPQAIALCLKDIAEAAGVNRQALYRSLSGDMTPRIDTLIAVLGALGMRLHVELAEAQTE